MMFEYWAHEASLLPLELYPLMRWRMERAERGERVYGGLVRYGRENADYIGKVLKEISERGPLAASDFDGQRGQGGWWGWSDVKHALEWLFWTGRVTTAERRPSFERVYDVPERVLPASVLSAPVPPAEDAIRDLLGIAARALGIATASDLRDYFRLPPEDVKARLPEMIEAGEVLPVKVEGWTQQAYLHKAARVPRKIEAQALVSPFDPLVWERSRAERLFDFRYRIEIYTPAEKRIHGYYVLPFLLDEAIAARVDLKADRQAGVLRVMASHRELDAPAHVAEALATELSDVATWLGLSDIEVAPMGELAPALSREIRTSPVSSSPA
jgi:uncharacterized protein YcaQ